MTDNTGNTAVNKDILEAFATAIDAIDKYTRGHSARVAEYSRMIAVKLGKSKKECDEIYYAALLHDVGKIGISGSIIRKKTALDEEEYEAINMHPVMGAEILSGIKGSPYLSLGARHHHEWFDGNGYPDHLAGKDIPEVARIIAVADSYDAMTSRRCYRGPMSQAEVRNELQKGSGTQFDPAFVNIMLHLIDLDKEFEMKERQYEDGGNHWHNC